MPGTIIKRVYVNKTLDLWLKYGFELDKAYDKQEFLDKLSQMIQHLQNNPLNDKIISILKRIYIGVEHSECKRVRLVLKGR